MWKGWMIGAVALAAAFSWPASIAGARSGETVYKVYFVARDQPPRAELRAVPRKAGAGSAGDTASLARQAMQNLCDGPGASESEAELGSRVPEGCRVLDARLINGELHLNMSRDWDQVWGFHAAGVFAQQVIRTLSQWPEVKQVWFYAEGKQQERLAQDGFTLPLHFPAAACELISVVD